VNGYDPYVQLYKRPLALSAGVPYILSMQTTRILSTDPIPFTTPVGAMIAALDAAECFVDAAADCRRYLTRNDRLYRESLDAATGAEREMRSYLKHAVRAL
jgi:hypothetical protein